MQGFLVAIPLLILGQGGKLEKKDLTVGRGAVAEVGDICLMHYTGKLTNGKQFDSSLGAGREPFTFVLGIGQVIKGWDLGVAGMRPGGKRTLSIPSSLGYGEAGAGQDIPPNANLVFDVELISVFKPDYLTLKKGTGEMVVGGDTVVVHYKGMFKDGKVFDTSIGKQPMPVRCGAPGMIPGFTQALYHIKVGEKRKVKIPAKYAFGAKGTPDGKIKPNTDLVFEIEAVSITKGGK